MSSEGRKIPDYFPLFCTSPELPANIIKKLIESRDVDGEAPNSLVLVSSHDQTSFEHGLKPQEAAVPSTFTGSSVEALGQFCVSKFVGTAPDDPTTLIADRMFIIADDRTLKGEAEKDYETVRLVQWDCGNSESADPSGPQEQVYRWETVRCKVDDVALFLQSFTHESLISGKLESETPLSDDDVLTLDSEVF